MSTLNWYVAPVCTDPEYGLLPGLEAGGPVILRGMLVHAYDPKDGVPTTCLVGVLPEFDGVTPAGWTPKTLEEAKAHFESVVGRPPSDLEVF